MTDENEFLQMGVEPAQYEALERDFKEVLSAMVGEKSMERFKAEYEKLHRALKTSYESEKRLVKRCKELNETIVSNATRVKAAIKLTQEDSNTIGVLKKEVDKAWRLVEQAKEKEEKARKIITDLKGEIAHLHKIVEQGSGLSFSQDNTVQSLMQAKEELKKDLTNKIQQILALEEAKAGSEERAARLETELIREKEEVDKLKQISDVLKEEHIREERKNKLAENEKKKQADQIKEKDATITANLAEQKRLNDLKNKLDNQVEQMKNLNDELAQKNREAESEKISALSRINSLEKDKQNLLEAEEESAIQIEQYASKLRQLEKENKRLDRDNKALELEKKRLTEAKLNAVNEKTVAKNAVSALTREIEWLRKQTEQEQSNIFSLVRDREMMKNSLKLVDEVNTKNKEDLKQAENVIIALKDQNRQNKESLQILSSETQKLDKEREKFSQEAAKANSNLMQMVEEVKLKKNLIGELKKETIDLESKLKQQQNLYEAVRSDRNLYSKNLIEAQDEVAELKRKFKIASHQISQLKDEIELKDTALTSTQHDLGMAKKEGDNDRAKMKSEVEKNKRLTENVKKLQNEQLKLTYIIKEAYIEHESKKKEYLKVVNERDVLGTQLIRRNDELALLYEKIKILQTTLSEGEKQYQQRLQDIQILNYSIADLRCELRIVTSQAAQIGDLRNEIINLNKQLLTERLSVKALSEELENPLNYHRWRKLEGTDPDTWEMLQKIQTLQKRLIKKTEEVVEKDVIIQEKEKLYVELKNLLARQPGPEVAEQLSIYQQNLKEKTSQMKAMAAELNMYQAQVNEYKYEIERLTRELQEMKRRYFEQKRREQIQREAQNKAQSGYQGIQAQTGPQQRFTGGGFNLAI